MNSIKCSTLLKILKERIKNKEIRFNYDGSKENNIVGLWVCDGANEYFLEFEELEEYLEKKENEPTNL